VRKAVANEEEKGFCATANWRDIGDWISAIKQAVSETGPLAAAVENILRQTALERLGAVPNLALVAALALLAALAGAFFRPGAAIASAALLVAALAAAATFLFAQSHLVLPLLPAAVSLALALLFAGGHRQVQAERERTRLRKSFELFLPPEVVARLVAENRLPALGGEEREITILFADLAGFTSRAETLTPQQTVALVNRYFAIVGEEVERQGGVVDKFIGDAVLAVFGAPLALPDHAAAAAEAALACRARLAALNAEDPTLKDDPLRQRIGLNTGRAVVGNVGTKRRLSYTVMGDAVNLAQRLQQANRGYGTDILASAATAQRSGERIEWRALATATVPGRREEVALFELVRIKGAAPNASARAPTRSGPRPPRAAPRRSSRRAPFRGGASPAWRAWRARSSCRAPRPRR
jgi:adenylate cyclase